MPPESRHKRRPRTVLFSTNNIDGLKIADQILCCENQKIRFETFENAQNLFSTGEGIEKAQRRNSKALSVESVVLQGSPLSNGIESTPMKLANVIRNEEIDKEEVSPVSKASERGKWHIEVSDGSNKPTNCWQCHTF